MARLRVNSLGGYLDAALTVAGTTITSDALAAAPAVASPDVLPIVLSPDGYLGGPYLAEITAHTAAATTATIEAVDTRAVDLPAGIEWVHAIQEDDLARLYEAPLFTGRADGADDLEFDEDGSTLPSGYAWVNQGTSTWGTVGGKGVLSIPTSVGNNNRMIVRSIPTPPFTVTTKVALFAQELDYQAGGLVLRDSATGELVVFGVAPATGVLSLKVERFTNPTTYDSTTSAVDLPGTTELWQRIVFASTSDVTFQVSGSGRAWSTFLSSHDPSGFLTVDQVGLFADGTGSPTLPPVLEADFVRFT